MNFRKATKNDVSVTMEINYLNSIKRLESQIFQDFKIRKEYRFAT